MCDEKNPRNDKSQVFIGIRKMQISYTIVYFQKLDMGKGASLLACKIINKKSK